MLLQLTPLGAWQDSVARTVWWQGEFGVLLVGMLFALRILTGTLYATSNLKNVF